MPFEIVGLRELDSRLFSSSYLVSFEEVICVVMIILYHFQVKITEMTLIVINGSFII